MIGGLGNAGEEQRDQTDLSKSTFTDTSQENKMKQINFAVKVYGLLGRQGGE